MSNVMPATSEPIVAIRDVHQSFGTVEVLKGIGFDANQIAELAERGIIGKPTS